MARLKSNTTVDSVYWEATIKESGDLITFVVASNNNLPPQEMEFFKRYTLAYLQKTGSPYLDQPSNDYPKNVIGVAELKSMDQLNKASEAVFKVDDNLTRFTEKLFQSYQQS